MSPKESAKRQQHLDTVGCELLEIKLSGDLLERVETISAEMDIAPGEVVRLALQRVVGGMAPELENELRRYIKTTGLGGKGKDLTPGLVDKHYRRDLAGGGEIIL
jgi:hypothetical protein